METTGDFRGGMLLLSSFKDGSLSQVKVLILNPYLPIVSIAVPVLG